MCRKDIGIRGEIGKKYKKTGSGRIEMAGDFSAIVESYLWKRLKNDDNDDDDDDDDSVC